MPNRILVFGRMVPILRRLNGVELEHYDGIHLVPLDSMEFTAGACVKFDPSVLERRQGESAILGDFSRVGRFLHEHDIKGAHCVERKCAWKSRPLTVMPG